jgi:hypothetical protein
VIAFLLAFPPVPYSIRLPSSRCMSWSSHPPSIDHSNSSWRKITSYEAPHYAVFSNLLLSQTSSVHYIHHTKIYFKQDLPFLMSQYISAWILWCRIGGIALVFRKFQRSCPIPEICCTYCGFLWVFSSFRANSLVVSQIMLKQFPSATPIVHNWLISLSFDVIQFELFTSSLNMNN